MRNVTKLFQELRKEHYKCAQRLGDCLSCSIAKDPNIEVFTHDQSYTETGTWVYFHKIEGTVIKEVADRLNLKYEWEGNDNSAFFFKEASKGLPQ